LDLTKLKQPKMIIFDYGHTLLYEPGHNPSNGNKAVYDYISKNPGNVTFEEFDETITRLFAEVKEHRGTYLEIHEHSFLKMAYEYMDIEMSIPIEEVEKKIWYGISKGALIPYADTLLDYLNDKGIRTGVISNICFSGEALKERINRFLPNNKMEFIMASSEYVFTKPCRHMFDIAIQKSGLSSDEIWFCGDSIQCDVYGAHGAGMFPVFYTGETPDDISPAAKSNKGMTIDFDYLEIKDWRNMIEILEKIPQKIS